MHRGNPTGGLIRDEARHDPSRAFDGALYIAPIALGLPIFAGGLAPAGWGAG